MRGDDGQNFITDFENLVSRPVFHWFKQFFLDYCFDSVIFGHVKNNLLINGQKLNNQSEPDIL